MVRQDDAGWRGSPIAAHQLTTGEHSYALPRDGAISLAETALLLPHNHNESRYNQILGRNFGEIVFAR